MSAIHIAVACSHNKDVTRSMGTSGGALPVKSSSQRPRAYGAHGSPCLVSAQLRDGPCATIDTVGW